MVFDADNFDESEGTSQGHFKVHHYLQNGLHRMDAQVRNGCEAETLALIGEVGKLLSIPFHIETKAYGEGGVEEYLVLVGQYKEQLVFITSLLGMVLSAPFYLDKVKQSKQKTKLNEVNLAKARLELKKMEEEAESPPGQSGHLALEPQPTSDDLASAITSTRKIAARRSNFYKALLRDPKIEAIGFSSEHRRGSAERIVKRAEFPRYVIECDELPPETRKNISIEIVAPVLRSGEMKWRGIFNKKTISFELGDWRFRQAVLEQQVQFQNGSALTCDLEVLQRYNEAGEVEITGYKVTRVHGISTIGQRPQEQVPLDFPPPDA